MYMYCSFGMTSLCSFDIVLYEIVLMGLLYLFIVLIYDNEFAQWIGKNII